MHVIIKKNCLYFLLLGLLTACNTLQQPTFNLNSTHYLKAQGKLAIIYTDIKNTTQSESGRFNWQQEQDHFNWYIAGPFGLGWVNLNGTPKQVTLTSQNGTNDNAATPEQLLQKYNLPSLPLSDLNWWIKGQPNPHKPVVFLQNASQSLRSFTQGAATIHYDGSVKHNNVNASPLPKKILITLPQGKVKLFINRWQQGSTP